MVGEQTVGECKGTCGKLAGTKTVSIPKVEDSPARYGGEECDLKPEEREEDCITDCCPGNPETHKFSYCTQLQLSVMRLQQRPTVVAAPPVVAAP